MKFHSLILIAVFLLILIHQDLWFWDDEDLMFGFLPIGLAFHIFYTIVISVFWFAISIFAFPKNHSSKDDR